MTDKHLLHRHNQCVTDAAHQHVPGMQADLLINARVRIACELMDGALPLPGQAN
jgi:hypothetical protein